jgi:hypothetical protein
MTLITKNYETYNEDAINDLFQKIWDIITKDYSSEFKIFSEGIRHTKRTILLLLIHVESNTKIEINCNNFFSVMNSSLIRNYLTYDARALILINTIKDWSKQKEINSNSKYFLSSYCYTLMTIFFLQRMKNPLLPIIYSNNNIFRMKISDKEFFIENELFNSSESMRHWHTENKEDTEQNPMDYNIFISEKVSCACFITLSRQLLFLFIYFFLFLFIFKGNLLTR